MLQHLQAVLVEPLFWGAVVAAYLLGSIPFGLVFAKWVKGVDLRTIGSGNIGASNAGRALGRGWAIVVFFCDFAKGLLPACVEVCPTEARVFGDLSQRSSPIQRVLRFNPIRSLKSELNTRPKVFYANADQEVR